MPKKRSDRSRAPKVAVAKAAAKPRRRAATTRKARASGKTNGPRKMKAYASFDLYLADQSRLHRQLIGVLRRFVRHRAPGLQESVKWGNGCWLKGKVPIAYVYAAPDYLQFGFVRGSALADPRGLLEGEGQYVRHIKLRRLADIDEAAFGALLLQAIG